MCKGWMGRYCSTQAGSELCGGVVEFLDDLVLVLSSLCCVSGIVCGLPIVKISLRMGVPEEQDVAVVGVPLPLPSIKCIFSALAATPLPRMRSNVRSWISCTS